MVVTIAEPCEICGEFHEYGPKLVHRLMHENADLRAALSDFVNVSRKPSCGFACRYGVYSVEPVNGHHPDCPAYRYDRARAALAALEGESA